MATLPSIRATRHRLASAARTALAVAGLAAAALAARPADAHAQVVAGGDFDIMDDGGTLVGGRARLIGRVGFGTNRGVFILVNGADATQDVDRDGYTPAINFTNLVVSDTTDFVNIADPSQSILRRNLVIADFLNPLNNGFNNGVTFYVNIPEGTPAGRYFGRFQITDPTRPPAFNPNQEALRVDKVEVEIEVLPSARLGLFDPNTRQRQDSLTLRGRPGQTVNGVVGVANTGNVQLNSLRLEATDLIATSGTGLRIRREQISFSPSSINTVGFGDSARITVTVRIPTGILAGAYRGEVIAQGTDVPAIRIPLTVIVTTPGDIVFETNPVIGRAGDNGVIIFNADAGTDWTMAIFDMRAIIAFKANGTVFAGAGTGSTAVPGDQAVRFSWDLRNGRGEDVAGGMYYVVVNAIQNGVRRQIRGRLMVIR